jgi:hypothetical protein
MLLTPRRPAGAAADQGRGSRSDDGIANAAILRQNEDIDDSKIFVRYCVGFCIPKRSQESETIDNNFIGDTAFSEQ